MPTPSDATERPGAPDPADVAVPDPGVRTSVLVRWGMALWAVVLAVLLLVPSLRADDRGWWLWVPVAGIALGALGHAYLARGRDEDRPA